MTYLSTFAKPKGIISPSSLPRTPKSLNRSPLSPTKRTERWLNGSASKHGSDALDLHEVKAGKVTKSAATASAKAPLKKAKSLWNIPILSRFFLDTQERQPHEQNNEHDLEGDTLIGEESTESKTTPTKGYAIVLDDEEGTRTKLDSYRDRPAVHSCAGAWTVEENWIYEKLSRRSHEPLMSASWQLDFPSFPNLLFTKHEDRTFINNLHTSIPCGKSSQTRLLRR